MKRQLLLQHRLQTLSALQEAVEAMRSLSAHHFRRARQALNPTRVYRSDMDAILSAIGIRQSLQSDAPAGLLVVSSDLGLCGDYNARLAQVCITEVKTQAAATIYCVGRRARAMLVKNSIEAKRSYAAPVSLEGLSHLLLGLAQDVLDDYLSEKIGSLHVVSARFEGVGHFTPLSTRVLPVQPKAVVQPVRPSTYISSDYLAMVAVREFLYITLYEILLDAIAAEHGMRLMATESAIEWLENTSAATARKLVAARSEAATQELLDIVAGSRKKTLTG